MKKLTLLALSFAICIFVNAQITNTKIAAENKLKLLYPNADEGDNSLFQYDKLSNSAKIAPSQIGKIKIVSIEDWIIVFDDGSYCVGQTIIYYHTFLGIPICGGHIANFGICP